MNFKHVLLLLLIPGFVLGQSAVAVPEEGILNGILNYCTGVYVGGCVSIANLLNAVNNVVNGILGSSISNDTLCTNDSDCPYAFSCSSGVCTQLDEDTLEYYWCTQDWECRCCYDPSAGSRDSAWCPSGWAFCPSAVVPVPGYAGIPIYNVCNTATGQCVQGLAHGAAGCHSDSDCVSKGTGDLCCGNVCTSRALDPNNCGGCGNSCGTGYSCLGGECISLSCDPVYGVLDCPGAGLDCCPVQGQNLCVSVLGDPGNCGSCGNSCSIGTEVCAFGECTTCGNGSCEEELGESCFNCADCACTSGSCRETSPGSGNYYCS